MSEPLTPTAELAMLTDLLESDGWQIVKRMVAARFGAEQQIADIDAAMRELRPGDDQTAVVTQIRAASLAALHVFALVESRVDALKQADDTKKPVDVFSGLRRIARGR